MNQDLTFMGNQFDEIVEIIDNARTRAMRAVNAELINMYWEIGAYISQKVEADGWGKSVVTEFSEFLRHRYPASKGFSAQNIWRMKQFYETYRGNTEQKETIQWLQMGVAKHGTLLLPNSKDIILACIR